MIRLLLHCFVPHWEQTEDPKVREGYSVLSGCVGIACNGILCLAKIIVGLFMNSIAIISDGFNNLSDLGSSVISILGAKLSNKRPDDEHPFGHGRAEYISSLIVAFLILLVGVELFKSSVMKIVVPEKSSFYPATVIVLILSVLVKLWMFSYNRYLGRQIHSTLLHAAARDSISDAISTGAVAIAMGVDYFLPISIDGYIGAAVSLVVLYSGYQIARETTSLLLGTAPDPEVVEQLRKLVLTGKEVVGVHDLIVHNYGPGCGMASIHAEVPENSNFMAVHEEIDALEQQAMHELGIMLVIHMDPIAVHSPRVNSLREMTEEIVEEVNSAFSIHDFRITDGEKRVNLIFDLVVPHTLGEDGKKAAVAEITEKIRSKDQKYHPVIQIDTLYI